MHGQLGDIGETLATRIQAFTSTHVFGRTPYTLSYSLPVAPSFAMAPFPAPPGASGAGSSQASSGANVGICESVNCCSPIPGRFLCVGDVPAPCGISAFVAIVIMEEKRMRCSCETMSER